MNSDTDYKQLMAKYVDGNADAFEAIYDHYKLPLWRYFRRQVGDNGAADDLLRETFVRLVHYRHNYEPTGPFSAYIFCIGHRRLMDFYRRRDKEKPKSYAVKTSEEIEFGSESVDPHLQPGQSERSKDLMVRLSNLPAAHREVFLLKHETDLSLLEIGFVVNVDLDTVQQRLRNAVQVLQSSLEITA